MKRLSLLLLLVGCTPSFQAASDVNDLRVLAVQAEPPEAQYDATSADPVHIRILAVDPAREGALSFLKWTICAPSDTRRCDQPIVPGAQGSATRHGGHEFSTDIAVPPALVSAFVGDDSLGGYLGTFFAQFAFSVDDGDPNGPVYADKAIVYSRRGPTPNHNPQMTGLALTVTGIPDRTILPGDTLTLHRGVEYGIRPLLADGARETYTTTDLTGKQVTLTEQPRYSFFTTTGAEFDRDTADEPIDGVAPIDGLTRIDSFRAGTGTMWVVVRDDRGGASWLEIPWTSD